MKYFYLLICITFSCFVNAQIINFPDANFKARLLQPDVAYDVMNNALILDANNDSQIEVSEVQNVSDLNLSNANISDLTGISNFVNLKSLNCNYNSLTSISISNAVSLIALNAKYNALTTVNVSYGIMEVLDLSHNNLTNFSVANANFADIFDLSYNQLSNLSITNCSFSYFFINHNNLSAVQFTGNVSFFWPVADFRNNRFSLLNFPANVFFDNAVHLELGDNTMDNIYFNGTQPGNIDYSSASNTSFDLGNFNMTRDCDPEEQGNVIIANSPNLQRVIFKNGYNHTELTCNEGGDVFQIPALNLSINNCPNLSQICVDQIEQPYFQTWINDLGLQNQVQVNTNCTSLVLGTETVTSDEVFSIAPNPAHSILEIQSRDGFTINGTDIYNSLGQMVQKEIGSQQSIDVSRLSSGIYYLKIKSSESSYTKRFVKE